MIPNGQGLEVKFKQRWHYLQDKKTISNFKRNNFSTSRDFYCLNCLHFFTTENKRESHKKVCENKHFCNTVMPSEDTKILEYYQYQKSDKAPFVIYAELEC